MKNKLIVVGEILLGLFLYIGLTRAAAADILEITFTGIVAEGSIDQTNTFGFGTGDVLGGRMATGVLRINLSRIPSAILNKPGTGNNYFDADASQTTWKMPSFSWMESSLSIDGVAAPDLVPLTANYANSDMATIYDGGTADHWFGQDWANTVQKPNEGQTVTYEDLLALEIYNADFLSGSDINQQFTLSGGPTNFAGVGTFRYTLMDNWFAPDFYLTSAQGFINLTSVTATILDTPNSTVPAPNYDGDGRSDYTVYRPSTGQSFSLPSGSPDQHTVNSWGTSGDVPVPGDYDGDGMSDLAVWRPSRGTWYIVRSNDPGTYIITPWGAASDIPVPGDYDADGKTDLAVWRPSNGCWYVRPSGSAGSYEVTYWGTTGDNPVPGDYNGDRRTDMAVHRPSTGYWYILKNKAPVSYIGRQWGTASDIPVPGDYDADGKTDIAVWRPSKGVWYILPSNASGYIAMPWGTNGDKPVVGDYDGDGKIDIGVWRPSDGTWYIRSSRTPGSYSQTRWGTIGDVPVSSITPFLKYIP